jgi:L-seryl-tRNA(Ser) seleniumtransferase
MPDRRGFLKAISSVPLLSGLLPSSLKAASTRDYFKELGVRPFINAAGTYTTLTASLMPPEAVKAIEYASKQYVRLNELQDAVGKRIAELIGCEAAMVTSGAAAALTVGTAGCITGKNQELIRRLPDTTGMKSEVIIQKSHRYGYDHAIRSCGTRFVEVETAEDLEKAVGPNTAMMMFFNAADPAATKIPAQQFVELGKKHNVPTFNDAAADTPPVERLSMYTKMGFDLVTFSGGKGIRGPQSAGLLLGRKDLIEAARLNTSPYSDSLARGMKVNKEEMLAMMVAVEVFVKKDHEAEWKDWEKRAKTIIDAATSVKGVSAEIQVPEIANHVPHIHITWDREQLKIAPRDVVRQLREGDPCIEPTPSGPDRLVIGVWMMQPGDDKVVAKRLKEILKTAVS